MTARGAERELGVILGIAVAAAVGEERGVFTAGYREGRDVTVFARGESWTGVLTLARERVACVDGILRDRPSTTNAEIATRALVPVRFVRLRRRDVGGAA
jgi:hypothetical protein